MSRRAIPPGSEARVPLQCKASEGTRERLQNAAAQSGRSLAQEIEMRLVQSLAINDVSKEVSKSTLDYITSRDEFVQILLGSRETISMLIDIAFIVQGIESGQEAPWSDSPELKVQLLRTLEAAMPALIRAPRGEGEPSAWLRAVDYAKYLPERPRAPAPEMPKGARFMTDDELKRFFYLNEDNADPVDAPPKRQRTVRAAIKK